MIKYDFKSLNANFSVFVKENFIFVVYVNDLLMIDESMKINIFEKKIFKERFHMIDLKFCSYYLNMFVIRNRRNRIFKSNQKEYLQRVLQNHAMLNNKFVVIFMNERFVKTFEIIESRISLVTNINSLLTFSCTQCLKHVWT